MSEFSLYISELYFTELIHLVGTVLLLEVATSKVNNSLVMCY